MRRCERVEAQLPELTNGGVRSHCVRHTSRFVPKTSVHKFLCFQTFRHEVQYAHTLGGARLLYVRV